MASTEAEQMRSLMAHPGWQLLTGRLTAVKTDLEQMILAGQCETKLAEDFLRMKRLNIVLLIEMPEKLAEMYDDSATEPDLDPYLTEEELALLKQQEKSHE